MNKAFCTIYRAFFRYSQQLKAAGQALEVRAPLDKEAFQTASYSWVVNESGACDVLYKALLTHPNFQTWSAVLLS